MHVFVCVFACVHVYVCVRVHVWLLTITVWNLPYITKKYLTNLRCQSTFTIIRFLPGMRTDVCACVFACMFACVHVYACVRVRVWLLNITVWNLPYIIKKYLTNLHCQSTLTIIRFLPEMRTEWACLGAAA